MEIIKKKIDEIAPAAYNPRKTMQSKSKLYEDLKKSLNKFGTVVPIIINKNTNVIVGGHQRINALKELGYEEVDVIELDLTDTEEKQLNIALNKIEGRWDLQKLDELIKSMTDKELQFTGFQDDEIQLSQAPPATTKKEKPPEVFYMYVSFKTKDVANRWLEEHGIDAKFESENSITILMEDA